MPQARASIPYARRFRPEEWQRIVAGVVPRSMEDKWLMYVEDDVLRLVRSWTGYCIFEIPLTRTVDGGAAAAGAWVNRDDAQYGGDDAYDPLLLDFLVQNFLLGTCEPFPLPPGEATTPEQGRGLLQHHLAGTGYPEIAFEKYVVSWRRGDDSG